MIRMVLRHRPDNGQKRMILVTPIMTEIRSAYDWSIVISPKPIRMRSPAAQQADDERINQLAGDEAAEHAVDISNTLDDTVGALDENTLYSVFWPAPKGILAVEDIKRDDNADQQVEQGRKPSLQRRSSARRAAAALFCTQSTTCGELSYNRRKFRSITGLSFSSDATQLISRPDRYPWIPAGRTRLRSAAAAPSTAARPRPQRPISRDRMLQSPLAIWRPPFQSAAPACCSTRYRPLNTGIRRYAITKP